MEGLTTAFMLPVVTRQLWQQILLYVNSYVNIISSHCVCTLWLINVSQTSFCPVEVVATHQIIYITAIYRLNLYLNQLFI